MSLFACTFFLLCDVFSLTLVTPSPYHGEVISEWSLVQYLILQKMFIWKVWFTAFPECFFNFFQGLNYQNDHFYTGCLDLLNSFFAFHSLKYLLFHVLFAVFHVLFSLFWGCNLFWIALRRALLIWGFRLPQNVLISFGVCLLSVFIFFSWNLSNPYSLWLRKFYTYSQVG